MPLVGMESAIASPGAAFNETGTGAKGFEGYRFIVESRGIRGMAAEIIRLSPSVPETP
jgi:hypothetical protein